MVGEGGRKGKPRAQAWPVVVDGTAPSVRAVLQKRVGTAALSLVLLRESLLSKYRGSQHGEITWSQHHSGPSSHSPKCLGLVPALPTEPPHGGRRAGRKVRWLPEGTWLLNVTVVHPRLVICSSMWHVGCSLLMASTHM